MKIDKMIDLSGNNNHAITGNMYEFAVTWNPLAGSCEHQCTYCYVENQKKRFKHMQTKYCGNPRLDKNAMKINLYSKKFKDKLIFVQGFGDLFANNVELEHIQDILDYIKKFPNNKYFFQTKNPERIINFIDDFPKDSIFCFTIETNRVYTQMGKTTSPRYRVNNIIEFNEISTGLTEITIEPIMDFDLSGFVDMIELCEPTKVNIGADSKKHNLPEPSKEKVLQLISELEKFTVVHKKSNLKRIIGDL